MIESCQTWNEQIAVLAKYKVVAPKLYVLRKIAKFVPVTLLSRIYKSCIQLPKS